MSSQPTPRVLVPVEVLEDPTPPGATAQMVAAGVEVVVLGYHAVPQQTAPGQMRMQYEEEALAALDAYAGAFEETGADVVTRLVFTGDVQQTFERIAYEEACTAILLPRPSEAMERILVPVRGEANLPRLLHVTARLLRDNEIKVTLFHVAEGEEEVQAGELLLRGARETLVEDGIDPDRVTLNVGESDEPLDVLAEAAAGFDGLILGETQPSLTETVFGPAHERIARMYDGPILIVRRADQEDVPIPDEAG